MPCPPISSLQLRRHSHGFLHHAESTTSLKQKPWKPHSFLAWESKSLRNGFCAPVAIWTIYLINQGCSVHELEPKAKVYIINDLYGNQAYFHLTLFSISQHPMHLIHPSVTSHLPGPRSLPTVHGDCVLFFYFISPELFDRPRWLD